MKNRFNRYYTDRKPPVNTVKISTDEIKPMNTTASEKSDRIRLYTVSTLLR